VVAVADDQEETPNLPTNQRQAEEDRRWEREWISKAEAMTPIMVEAKLIDLTNREFWTVKQLKDARDAETEADIAYRKARLRAYAHTDCPKPQRGGATVGERDAWVDAQVVEEWEALRRAETATTSAADYVKLMERVSTKVQTIARLVEQAYNVSGRREK